MYRGRSAVSASRPVHRVQQGVVLHLGQAQALAAAEGELRDGHLVRTLQRLRSLEGLLPALAPETADTLVLVVSELVTNALRHGGGISYRTYASSGATSYPSSWA
jgi:signal transduction histidine kinase